MQFRRIDECGGDVGGAMGKTVGEMQLRQCRENTFDRNPAARCDPHLRNKPLRNRPVVLC